MMVRSGKRGLMPAKCWDLVVKLKVGSTYAFNLPMTERRRSTNAADWIGLQKDVLKARATPASARTQLKGSNDAGNEYLAITRRRCSISKGLVELVYAHLPWCEV